MKAIHAAILGGQLYAELSVRGAACVVAAAAATASHRACMPTLLVWKSHVHPWCLHACASRAPPSRRLARTHASMHASARCALRACPPSPPAHTCAQVVVSDKPSCNAVAYAEQHGIPTLTFPIPKGSEHPGLTTQQVVQELQQRADFVILAGYLKVTRCCGMQGASYSSQHGLGSTDGQH